MKKQDGYELMVNLDSEIIRFKFSSTGSKGTIEKVIEFTYLQDNYWNLGFGDVNGNDWDDNVISDNNDLRKVLQTIANAVHSFFDYYPNHGLLILPLDNQRKLLYNRVFQQKWEEIDLVFTVKAGTISSTPPNLEDYSSLKMFDDFVICRKNSIFDFKNLL